MATSPTTAARARQWKQAESRHSGPERVLQQLLNRASRAGHHANGRAQSKRQAVFEGRNCTVTAQQKERLHELRGMRPALSQCRLFGKILDNWEPWTSGAPDPDGGTDKYWWL